MLPIGLEVKTLLFSDFLVLGAVKKVICTNHNKVKGILMEKYFILKEIMIINKNMILKFYSKFPDATYFFLLK